MKRPCNKVNDAAKACSLHIADCPSLAEQASPNWNPKCDINKDHVVNVKDIYSAMKDFGKRL